MASRSNRTSDSGLPEFAVRWETISRFFEPPMARSTFHDFVKKGRIIPMKGLRGFYHLNESLQRLGLREVKELPSRTSERSMEDILHLAFNLIDPTVFPLPGWTLQEEEISYRDLDQAKEHAALHRENVNGLRTTVERVNYLAGVIDGHDDIRRESGLA